MADSAGAVGRKIFKKGAKNPKIGVREVPEGGLGTPYIGCVGRFFRPGGWASSSVARGALRADNLTTSTHSETSQRDVRDSLLLCRELYMEYLPASFIARLIEVSPLVRHTFL